VCLRVTLTCLLPSGWVDAELVLFNHCIVFGLMISHVSPRSMERPHFMCSGTSLRRPSLANPARLATRGLDPMQAKRCQVSSSCPSEPLHASAACLDNALHAFSRGLRAKPSITAHAGTRPSSYILVVHVFAVSRSISPICRWLSGHSIYPTSLSPPHRDPAKQAFELSI
jgi:hypothetical protein